jgi:hypothetical protein
MSHIPYGYRISAGKAVPDPETAPKLRQFFALCLSGRSVAEALAEAGIPRSKTTGRKLLRNRVYLGDGFYPPLLEEALLREAAALLDERKAKYQAAKPGMGRPPAPVRTRFYLDRENWPEAPPDDLRETIQFLYRRIRPEEATPSADPETPPPLLQGASPMPQGASSIPQGASPIPQGASPMPQGASSMPPEDLSFLRAWLKLKRPKGVPPQTERRETP